MHLSFCSGRWLKITGIDDIPVTSGEPHDGKQRLPYPAGRPAVASPDRTWVAICLHYPQNVKSEERSKIKRKCIVQLYESYCDNLARTEEGEITAPVSEDSPETGGKSRSCDVFDLVTMILKGHCWYTNHNTWLSA